MPWLIREYLREEELKPEFELREEESFFFAFKGDPALLNPNGD